ncbi:MAG TPA: cysteine desulfurase [Thermoanaerobaculia bacterium]
MTTTMASLAQRVRADFPILAQEVNGHALVYLDNGATAQKPRLVLDRIATYYERDNANVHRGMHELARRATDDYEAARVKVAHFVNAADPSEIVWTRGTTEAINLVAATWGSMNLEPGDEILLTVMEHHSNLIPWQLLAQRTGAVLRFLDVDDEGRLRLEQMEALLSRRTKLVAFNHVSNSLGTINPVAQIVERAHAVGARVLIDGAQAAPHLPIDVQALGVDFYAISGHKMGGPMGIGALWARRELLEEMPPYQGGGEMIDLVELDRSTYARVPHKFEAGTPNVGGAVGIGAAIDYLAGLGHDAIAAHERALVDYGTDKLNAVTGLRLFGPKRADQRIAVFSFTVDGVHPHDLATILDAEGIAIRAGHHCTQPLMRRLCVPATARASCWVYTTTEDLDRLAEGVRNAQRIFG